MKSLWKMRSIHLRAASLGHSNIVVSASEAQTDASGFSQICSDRFSTVTL